MSTLFRVDMQMVTMHGHAKSRRAGIRQCSSARPDETGRATPRSTRARYGFIRRVMNRQSHWMALWGQMRSHR